MIGNAKVKEFASVILFFFRVRIFLLTPTGR